MAEVAVVGSGESVETSVRGDAGVGRLAWIDELRFVAFCAVALLHVAWVETTTLGGHDVVVFATRFAVPAFFMIAGFLIGSKGRDAAAVASAARRRVLPVFLFWEAVYIGVDVAVDGAFRPLPDPTVADLVRFALVTLYDGGAAFHLWFLVWFAVSVLIFSDLRRLGPGWAWTGVLALFAVGAAIGPYGAVTGLLDHVGPLASRPIAYTARNGPFFGPLFLMIGDAFARRDLRPSPAVSIGLIAVGFALEIAEGVGIAAQGHRFVSIWDVTFGTPILTIGVFGLARTLRGRVATSPLAGLGRLSLGMYCVHGLFIEAWKAFVPPELRPAQPLAWTFAAAVAVVAASGLVAHGMARVPGLRRFVV